METRARWILVVSAACVAALLLYLVATDEPPAPEPTSSSAVALAPPLPSSEPAPGAERAAVVPQRFARDESRPATRPRRGVRGIVTSPHVRRAHGSQGVDPEHCEVYADLCSESLPDRTTVYRRNDLRSTRPRSDEGDFELPLELGRYRICVEHLVDRADEPPLLEAWYAFVEIGDRDRDFQDIGRGSFAKEYVRGRVMDRSGLPPREPSGAPARVCVNFSDKRPMPQSPFVRGAEVETATDPLGRFALSLARSDPGVVLGRLLVFARGAHAIVPDVCMGRTVDVTLELAAAVVAEIDVTIEVACAESPCLWLWSEDGERFHAPARDVWDGAKAGWFSAVFRLPPGHYFAELIELDDWYGDRVAREEMDVGGSHAITETIVPRWQPARRIEGKGHPGAPVARRIVFGGGLSRDVQETRADASGCFVLRGIQDGGVVVASGSAQVDVPPGAESVVFVGDLRGQ